MTDRQLPRDPALGDLALMLPAVGAPAVVAEAARADASAATVEHVRWRPGRSCTVLWSFPRRGDTPLLVSGRLRAGGVRRLVSLARNGSEPLRVRTSDPLRGALHIFPRDEALPGLAFAADPLRVGAEIGSDLARAVPVAYKPMRRCVLRYDDAAGRARFFGKVFRDGRGAPMPDWLTALRDQLAVWELPVPAGYLSAARLLLFEAVEGAAELSRLLRGGDGGALTAVARAAEGLAELRRAALDGLGVVTPRDVLRPLERGSRELELVVPELAGPARARLRALAHVAAELPPEPLALSHGAFRAGQLLVRAGRIVVLDLDSLALAGEAADIGSFLAGLDLTGVRSPRLRARLAECEAVFVEAVERAAPADPRWIAWHRSAACVEHALRRAYALEPGWRERMTLLLDRAAEILLVPAAP